MVSSFKILVRPFGRAFGPNQDAFLRLSCCGKAGRKKEIFVRCFSDSQENIVRSSFRHITIPEVSFHDFIFEKFGEFEDRIAIECVVSNKKVSYKQVRKTSKNLASSLQKKFNLKKGDQQSVLLPNCPEFPCIILGGSLIGVSTSPMNPMYTPVELSKQIEIAAPKIIFTDVGVWKKCSEALNLLQLKIPIVTVKMFKDDVVPPGAVNFSELVEYSTPTEYDPVTVDGDDDVVIPFSSGTSGLPKGVQLSHRNVVSNLYQVSDAATILRRDPSKGNEPNVVLAILPMFHIYGMMTVCFDGLRNGAELKSMPKFEAKTFVQTLFLKKVETAYLVPPLIFFLAHQPAVEEKHLQYLKVVITGAAPCGPSDILAFNRKFPNLTICQGYGMTETSPVISASHIDRVHKVGSVGHPLSLTLVKVADTDTGKALPQKSLGEICIKGPQVMKGYFKQPEITKQAFDSDGFLKTGDIGYCDEDNDLFIVDRLKELIKVKGYQVAPAEIEEFLRSHPKIADAGVVGVPHDNQGEAPKAFVVLKEGVSMTEEDVMRFVEENLSESKQLKGGVQFLKEIPKSSAGKILRKALKKLN